LPTLSLTTELDAVNAILASVGESPIVSLDDTFVDAEMARDLLHQRLRAVQLIGWTFNTETDYSLSPDNLGRIFVPGNTLKIVPENPDIVLRGTQLYDRENKTNTFAAAVKMQQLVLLLDFDECPEAMRLFVTIQAGRRMQDRYQGMDNLHKFQATDENAAWAALLNYEADVAQWNLLQNNALNQRIKWRR
jgi:hypothetical protein